MVNDKVRVRVNINSFTYEGGSYGRGQVFVCDRVRAASFDPVSVTIELDLEPTLVTPDNVDKKAAKQRVSPAKQGDLKVNDKT